MEPREQYKNLLSLVRHEGAQLFNFNNFFFLAQTGLMALWLNKSPDQQLFLSIAGFFLALFWLVVLIKQEVWRKRWIDKMKEIERDHYQNLSKIPLLWDKKGEAGGLWQLIKMLPVLFALIWLFSFFV